MLYRKTVTLFLVVCCTLLVSSLVIAAPIQSASPLPDVPFRLQIPLPDFSDTNLCKQVGEAYQCPGIVNYIVAIYRWLLGATAILAVLMIMVAGFSWMTSGGNTGLIESAKKRMSDALIGLLLLISTFIILQTLNPALITLPVLNLGKQDTPTVSLASVGADSSDKVLFTSGGGSAGGVSDIRSRDTTYDTTLKAAAESTGTDCTLLKAIMYAESGGNKNAISYKGAVGLMQVMPSSAQLSRQSLLDPTTNINAGARYVRYLSQHACKGSRQSAVCNATIVDFVIAAYNGGPGANTPSVTCPGTTWWQCGANGGYLPTRHYVPKVKANYEKLKREGWGC